MHQVIAIPALSDNYIWAIVDDETQRCVLVDPGESAPAEQFLVTHNLKLTAILITHHHWDHTGGIEGLLAKHPVHVYGYKDEPIKGLSHPLGDGETFTLPEIDLELQCLHIPGHTLGHAAFVGHGWAFTGDMLFTAGCGKIFEGNPDIMFNSLSRLAQLPKKTLIFCGHEYTQANLQFAALVEPNNHAIQQRIAQVVATRAQGLPTVPAPLSLELETNPFLRCEQASVINAASDHAKQPLSSASDVLATIRAWKNSL